MQHIINALMNASVDDGNVVSSLTWRPRHFEPGK